MLHILFFILKILGIILAVILGILILFICIFLFVPVRYEILGSCGGALDSLKVKIRVTWLLHLVRADALYKGRRFRWKARAAWIRKGNGSGHAQQEASGEREEEFKEKREEDKKEIKEEKKVEKAREERSAVSGECEKSRQEADVSVEEQQEEAESMEENAEEESEAPKISEIHEESEGNAEKGTGLYEKIQKILQKIKCTFQDFCDKIKTLLDKKEKLTSFITDEVHAAAFRKVKKEGFRLFRRLNPKKLEVRLMFGFEDPCLTGQVLAVFSVLYPLTGDHVDITPDFGKHVLQGRCCVKGKLYAWHFAQVCWNLFWCKDVRETYRHVRNFQI